MFSRVLHNAHDSSLIQTTGATAANSDWRWFKMNNTKNHIDMLRFEGTGPAACLPLCYISSPSDNHQWISEKAGRSSESGILPRCCRLKPRLLQQNRRLGRTLRLAHRTYSFQVPHPPRPHKYIWNMKLKLVLIVPSAALAKVLQRQIILAAWKSRRAVSRSVTGSGDKPPLHFHLLLI